MSFYEKLNNLCKERGTSPTAVALTLGFSTSASTTWKNAKGMPRSSTIKKITEYFGVPITYFNDDPEKEKAPGNMPEAEDELIRLINLMPPEMKAVYVEALRVSLKAQGLIP